MTCKVRGRLAGYQTWRSNLRRLGNRFYEQPNPNGEQMQGETTAMATDYPFDY